MSDNDTILPAAPSLDSNPPRVSETIPEVEQHTIRAVKPFEFEFLTAPSPPALPLYKDSGSNRVRAAKITAINENTLVFGLVGLHVYVTDEWMVENKPEIGEYYADNGKDQVCMYSDDFEIWYVHQ
jgi:hypothetical protein